MADFLTRLGRVGASTLGGAGSGSFLGPWGTIGGAALGLIGGLASDSAANDAEAATEEAQRQQQEAVTRNRTALEQLANGMRAQANPFSDPRALAGQYNQIAHAYAGQGATLDQSLAARGMAGQGQDAAMRANLAAAQANAVTGAQQDNVARQADWEQNRQNQLMQLQSLAQAGDANAMQQAMQLAQNRQQTAQSNAQGLNNALSSLAAVGAMSGGKPNMDVTSLDWGGMAKNAGSVFQNPGQAVHNALPQYTSRPTPMAPESFSGPYAPGFTPQAIKPSPPSPMAPPVSNALQGLSGRRRTFGGY